MIGTCCEACGHEPKNPHRSLYWSAMLEQTRCVDGVACKRRAERRASR